MSANTKKADELLKLDGKADVHPDVQARINSVKYHRGRKARDAVVAVHETALVRTARLLGVEAPKAAKKAPAKKAAGS